MFTNNFMKKLKGLMGISIHAILNSIINTSLIHLVMFTIFSPVP